MARPEDSDVLERVEGHRSLIDQDIIMTRFVTSVSLGLLLTFVASDIALARGGAANIMDSPGYQRRLQESRGLVPVQSAQPTPQPVYRVHRGKPRHRH